jgi:hypothetical protein
LDYRLEEEFIRYFCIAQRHTKTVDLLSCRQPFAKITTQVAPHTAIPLDWRKHRAKVGEGNAPQSMIAFNTVPVQPTTNVEWLTIKMHRVNKVDAPMIMEKVPEFSNWLYRVVLPAQIHKMGPWFWTATKKMDGPKIHLNHAPASPRYGSTRQEMHI